MASLSAGRARVLTRHSCAGDMQQYPRDSAAFLWFCFTVPETEVTKRSDVEGSLHVKTVGKEGEEKFG